MNKKLKSHQSSSEFVALNIYIIIHIYTYAKVSEFTLFLGEPTDKH